MMNMLMMETYQYDQRQHQHQRSYSSDTFSSDQQDNLKISSPKCEQPFYSNIDYEKPPTTINQRSSTPVHQRIFMRQKMKIPKVVKKSSPALCQVRPSVQSMCYPFPAKAPFVSQRGTLDNQLQASSTFSSTSSFECVRTNSRPVPATSMMYPQFIPAPPQIIYWPIPYPTMLPPMVPVGYQMPTRFGRTSASRIKPPGFFQSMTQQTVY